MSDETPVDTTPNDAPAAAEPKPRRRGGNRKPRKPKLKDWVRVIHSQGNGLENKFTHLIVNQATNLVELVTNAPKQEGSEEMEGERTQVFRIDSVEFINDPNRDPLAIEAAKEEAAAAAAEAGAEAPAEASTAS